MKVTIITANFNREKTLARTIESVLDQTHDQIEYIIIDGKSTDSSLKIIESYREKFQKRGYEYKYISETDTGIYNAMNKGIRMATGDIIGIIGSDDWYEKNTLEIVSSEFEKDLKLKMIYGLMRTIKEGKFYQIRGDYNSFGIGYHPTIFLKSEIYKNFNFNEKYRIAADTDLLLKLKKEKIKNKFVEEILTNFSLSGISTIDKFNTKLEDIEIEYEQRKITKLKKYKKILKLIRKNLITIIKNKIKGK